MCLTLANATTVLDHRSPAGAVRGYTRTWHQARLLSPGDLWQAVDSDYPRTAVLVRPHRDRITVTDQYGVTFSYACDEVIATAVPDAFAVGRKPRSRGHPVAASAGIVPPGR